MKQTLLIIILVSLLSVSCKDDNTDAVENTTSFAFAGSWTGTYIGDDDGTLDLVVQENGRLAGTIFSNNIQQSVNITGTINEDGQFIDCQTSTGTKFNGSISPTKGDGTWRHDILIISGTWTAQKS
jgi:hypothetical protein